MKVIQTPIRAPNVNAYAERWVRSACQECFDHLIIVNDRHHWHSILRKYVDYYDTGRPHQGLGQHCPEGKLVPNNGGMIHCREVLGGLMNDYYRKVA